MKKFIKSNTIFIKPLVILFGIGFAVSNILQESYKMTVGITIVIFSILSYLSARNEHKRWAKERMD